MLRALLPHLRASSSRATRNPRALPPATLASLAGQLGGAGVASIEPDPRARAGARRELAGADGAVLATGSIYLVADLAAPRRAPARRRRCERRRRPAASWR